MTYMHDRLETMLLLFGRWTVGLTPLPWIACPGLTVALSNHPKSPALDRRPWTDRCPQQSHSSGCPGVAALRGGLCSRAAIFFDDGLDERLEGLDGFDGPVGHAALRLVSCVIVLLHLLLLHAPTGRGHHNH